MLPSTFLLAIAAVHGASAAVIPRALIRIVQGNDDGWAVKNIRDFFDVLNANGFSSIISSPAQQRSGTGSLDIPPLPIMLIAGQFDSIVAGSPGIGFNASDLRLNYVDSFPVTAIKNGIKLAPELLGGPPDLVLAGPNVGSNLGIITQFSGTVAIASEAMEQGIPAIAFSVDGGTQHSFTEPDPVADVSAQVALKIVQAVTTSKPFLPNGVALNVNIPAGNCTDPSNFSYVLSRVNHDINPFTPDVNHCNSTHLPTESHVIDSGNCRVSISAFEKWKIDVKAEKQQAVRDKLKDMLTCLPA